MSKVVLLCGRNVCKLKECFQEKNYCAKGARVRGENIILQKNGSSKQTAVVGKVGVKGRLV